MSKSVNLLSGSIVKSISSLAFPIMCTSMLQMAYNLVDMMWIGRLGSNALAAVGSAGMFVWLANSLCNLSRMGGQVKLANSLGENNNEKATSYATTTMQLGLFFGISYSLICLLSAPFLISFFQLNDITTINSANIYLTIAGGGSVFQFFNMVATGLITCTGNSKTPFKISVIGLVFNMILDPIFIFGFGFIPALGVAGAAIATVTAQIVVTLLYINYMKKELEIFAYINLPTPIDFTKVRKMLAISIPISLQSMSFTVIAMFISRMIAQWGDGAIAAQKVGTQVESISWLITEGFASALTAFMAQNHGALQHKRTIDGYKTAMKIVLVWATFTTALLLIYPEELFSLFLRDPLVLPLGASYLRIIGYSQLLMCVEILTNGAFAGYGYTVPCSTVSVIFTLARIPMAIGLSSFLGLDGIWWTISLSAMFKGIVMPIIFAYYYKKRWSIAVLSNKAPHI